ncbi:carbohydrate ABC transporter permease [Nocardioides speluncae]|uniref:carbohydrate ABC transporter permease n=1 Tax=Nocardioides speluncae TaxID=2670337 RepID=UPI000D689042|nr:sugar ABC transporter permease [Nocardioides speluncae]
MSARSRARRTSLPLGLVLPAAALLALALAYPLGRQVVLSLQSFGLAQQFGAPPEWVGIQNYRDLVGDSYLWTVVLRTVIFCFVNAALTLGIGMGIAVLMTKMTSWVRIAAQCGLLLAWAMPVVAAMIVWQFLFDTEYGAVNAVLTWWGGDYESHSWLASPMSFFAVATLIVVWMSVPFVVFTLYAALTQVSDDVVEAAEIDGAGGWQRFVHVVLPSIRPVLLVVLLLQLIWDLRVFTQIYTLQKAGGITRDTNLLGTYIYSLGIKGGDFGTAAAAAMFMLALTVVVTAPYIRMMLKQED